MGLTPGAKACHHLESLYLYNGCALAPDCFQCPLPDCDYSVSRDRDKGLLGGQSVNKGGDVTNGRSRNVIAGAALK